MSDEPMLFDPDEIGRTALTLDESSEPITLRDKYERFNKANPHVFQSLAHMAIDLKAKGVQQYGIAALFEVLRYEHTMSTTDDSFQFKLSNSYKPFYARDIMAAFPELQDFFVIRPSVADE